MKPEIGYDRIVIGSYINDILEGVEWNLRHTALRDPYFEQLSVEKFTLETLLKVLAEHHELEPEDVIDQFVQQADKCARESQNPNSDYTFSVSRDAALSILDGLYFGYLEGEERSGF